MKKINTMYAEDERHIIGHRTGEHFDLPPWRLTDDFKLNFIPKTKGSTVIMGKNTALTLNKPLVNRKNIFLTRGSDPRSLELVEKGFIPASSLEEAIHIAEELPGDTIWIIGGGEIYRLAFSRLQIDEIHVSKIHASFPAPESTEEITVPEIDPVKFRLDPAETIEYKKREPNKELKDNGNSHDFTIEIYKRIA